MMFQWEEFRERTAELKPRGVEDNTYNGEINVKVSDFTKLMENHLKWLSHSGSFLRKKKKQEE